METVLSQEGIMASLFCFKKKNINILLILKIDCVSISHNLNVLFNIPSD